MRNFAFFIVAILFATNIFAQKVKNLIIMVPDGTSIASLSLARWYKSYDQSTKASLNIDPYFCGLVTNHSSNAPTADSAPAMTWYMTGHPSQTAFISMYPPKDKNDIYPMDSTRRYSPMVTLMEAARIEKGKSLGLVFTCEFPHATPAATSSHWYSRKDYSTIVDQMVHNSIDVVIGGGVSILNESNQKYLREAGYDVTMDDIASFRRSRSPKLWSLFGEVAMPNDFDRDTVKYPSLAEMTTKAIATLRHSREGFVLMVEGSKIDWAAHANDPIGIISDVLAFDEAVKVAIEFAKESGETAVVVMPDHGNSGISIGNSHSNKNYDRLSLKDIISPLNKARKTAEGVSAELISKTKDDIAAVVKQYWDIELSVDEINWINVPLQKYNSTKLDAELYACTEQLSKIMQSRSYVGFTTTGHTAEDLFLAVYSPINNTPRGLLTATELNKYMGGCIGLEQGKLDALSKEYYCPSTELFREGNFSSTTKGNTLIVTNGKFTMTFKANTNIVFVNDKRYQTKTPAIYVDKNQTWYISKEVVGYMYIASNLATSTPSALLSVSLSPLTM